MEKNNKNKVKTLQLHLTAATTHRVYIHWIFIYKLCTVVPSLSPRPSPTCEVLLLWDTLSQRCRWPWRNLDLYGTAANKVTKWLQLGILGCIKGVALTQANGDSAEYPSMSPTAEQQAGTPSLMFGVKIGALWTTRWLQLSGNNCDKAGAEGGGRGTDAPASCYPWHQTHPVLAQGITCDCRCIRGLVSNGQEGRQGLLSHVVSVSAFK